MALGPATIQGILAALQLLPYLVHKAQNGVGPDGKPIPNPDKHAQVATAVEAIAAVGGGLVGLKNPTYKPLIDLGIQTTVATLNQLGWGQPPIVAVLPTTEPTTVEPVAASGPANTASTVAGTAPLPTKP